MSHHDYQSWLWSRLGEKTSAGLKKHGFDAHLLEDAEEARSLALDMGAGYESFGFAGSATTRGLGLIEELKAGGKLVYDHWKQGLTKHQDLEIRRQQMQSQCFFCSANAVSATGEIVNVDGIGNRTNGMTFGPDKVVIIAGMNKVTQDLASAIKRVKETAAPMRAKSLGMDTPCAETGICSDCNSPQRICRVTTILHRRPMLTDISVLLVKEAMGF